MNKENPSGDVIDQENATGDVIDQQEQVSQPGDSVTVEGDQAQENKTHDDYWKNRAMELERKQKNLADELPSLIREEMQSLKSEVQTQKQPKHTIEQLEAYLESEDLSTNDRVWAKAEIRKLEREELEKSFEERQNKLLRQQQDQTVRQQTLQQVVSNEAFKDAFMVNPNGSVDYNPRSELASRINSYMSSPELKDRPDALMLASKLAYSDLALEGKVSSGKAVSTLKRENSQLKKQTLSEGGGAPVQSSKDSFSKAQEDLAAGKRGAGKAAIKEYFKKYRS